jgi:hypothetical protein
MRGNLLETCFMLDTYVAYTSALKIEVNCSSEKSVDCHRCTSEDIIFPNLVQKKLPLGHILSKINPIRTLLSYFWWVDMVVLGFGTF